jgi:RNA polymerase sigma-70 factor (ECF subfamily)
MQLPWFKSRTERRFYKELMPHADALHHYALRRCRNVDEAQDLVQETMMKAFKALDRIPEGSNYKGWLFTILRNTHVSRLRRLGVVEYTDTPPDNACSLPNPLQHVTDGRLGRPQDRFDDEVCGALNSLPEAQRTAVLLCDVEKMPYEDIAKILKCPIGTVRSRIFHGRRALRELLSRYAKDNGVIRNKEIRENGKRTLSKA